MKLTKAQLNTLELCEAYEMTPGAKTVCSIRQDVLNRLLLAGLIRWMQFARPQRWGVTPEGRRVLKEAGKL